jgi:hypothetical protein
MTSYDPETKIMAAIGSSSGPIGNPSQYSISHYYKKDEGIFVVGAYTLSGDKLLRDAFNKKLSLEEQASFITDNVHQPIRVTGVSRDFNVVSRIANGGCHSLNHFCGERVDTQVAITGGGLHSIDVINESFHYFNRIKSEGDHLACKLYNTMKKAYLLGGEIKQFNRVVMIIDDPIRSDVVEIVFKRSHNQTESVLLSKLVEELRTMNIHCLPTYSNTAVR